MASPARTAQHPPLRGPLNYKSAMDICQSEQVMVYGWGHCKYLQVAGSLAESNFPDNPSPFKKIYDCAFGDTRVRTLEGRRIQEMRVDIPDDDYLKELNRRCKSGVTNLVFENFQRREEGLSLIPLLFCIDIDDTGDHPWDKRRNRWDFDGPNPWRTTPELLCEKDRMTVTGQMNDFTTHSELRRCFKLANTFSDPRIRNVANSTFKFVRVVQNRDTLEYRLESVRAPWDHADWDRFWKKRMEIGSKQQKASTSISLKRYPWRKELSTAIDRYDAHRIHGLAELLASKLPKPLDQKKIIDLILSFLIPINPISKMSL